jgi:hypothetical protein
MDPSGSHTSDCWHGTAALEMSKLASLETLGGLLINF